ncbi:MAG: HAD-IC family P-type ATPase [Legionella sp.]|nr:HAD-IC family P-type ATPase [Legionella sp.]
MSPHIYTYDIPGITCTSCAKKIKTPLYKLSFTDNMIDVDVPNQKLIFQFEDKIDKKALDKLVIPILKEAGFDISKPHALLAGFSLFSGVVVLLLPLFLITMPFSALAALGIFSTALTGYLGWPFYRSAYHEFRQGTLGMDSLLAMSTLVIIAVSLTALFVPGLPMMFEVGLLVFGFRHVGIAIREAFIEKLPKVKRFQDSVQADAIQVGDKLNLSAKPGNNILPVNGIFLSGKAKLCLSCQTGEDDVSVDMVPGKPYVAGTKIISVLDGPLIFKATETAQNSFLVEQDKAVLKSNLMPTSEKNKNTSMAYWLNLFVPIVFGVALLSGLVGGLYFSSWLIAIQCAVSVLLAACPCTLGLIEPLVTQVGIKKISEKGMLVRDSESLEKAAKVNRVMLDLNGTLTLGSPQLVDAASTKELLALLPLMAYLEQDQEHRLACAIREAAKNMSSYVHPEGAKPELLDKQIQGGIQIKLGEDTYALGNQDMMNRLGVKDLDLRLGEFETRVYCVKNGEFQGHLTFANKARPGAVDVINMLDKQNIPVYVCTGTDKDTAMQHIKSLGIQDKVKIYSGCNPQDKKDKLDALRADGKCVLTVGDGMNDAQMLAGADVGVSVGHKVGHEGIQGCASAVLETESLLPILDLLKIARKTTSNINQNIGFNIIYSALTILAPTVLLFGLGMVLNPAVWPALMVVQTILTLANIYRFKCEAEPGIEIKKPVAGLNATVPPVSFEPKAGLSACCKPKPTASSENDEPELGLNAGHVI